MGCDRGSGARTGWDPAGQAKPVLCHQLELNNGSVVELASPQTHDTQDGVYDIPNQLAVEHLGFGVLESRADEHPDNLLVSVEHWSRLGFKDLDEAFEPVKLCGQVEVLESDVRYFAVAEEVLMQGGVRHVASKGR